MIGLMSDFTMVTYQCNVVCLFVYNQQYSADHMTWKRSYLCIFISQTNLLFSLGHSSSYRAVWIFSFPCWACSFSRYVTTVQLSCLMATFSFPAVIFNIFYHIDQKLASRKNNSRSWVSLRPADRRATPESAKPPLSVIGKFFLKAIHSVRLQRQHAITEVAVYDRQF